MTRNLTVHFKRRVYLVTPNPETLPLGGREVTVHQWEDGMVEIRCEGRILPFVIFDKNRSCLRGAWWRARPRRGPGPDQVQPGRARQAAPRIQEAFPPREAAPPPGSRAGGPAKHDVASSGHKADISTWAGSGHLYLGLTKTLLPVLKLQVARKLFVQGFT